mgnify:CR=1 FL=1
MAANPYLGIIRATDPCVHSLGPLIVDVWFSLWLEDRYSYHWERRAIDGTLYRCNNAPHKRWASVKSRARDTKAGPPAGAGWHGETVTLDVLCRTSASGSPRRPEAW